MEFKSIAEFKQTILEHSILNAKQIKFVKNKKIRARAVCKGEGNKAFTVFVSRVDDNYTYKMKTFIGKHTCGTVFNKVMQYLSG